MIHRDHGKADKTLHSHCYLCLTFPRLPSKNYARSNLTIVIITVWTMTQWKTQLSKVPRKRKAQWDLNPSLFVGFGAHTYFSAFCCGMCQQKINPESLAVSGSAQNPSCSSNLHHLQQPPQKTKKVSLCLALVKYHAIHPFSYIRNTSFTVYLLTGWKEKMTKSHLPLLHMHIPIHPGASLCIAYFSVSWRSLEETWKVC